MPQAQDLMGLGMPPALAAALAADGTPTVTSAGSSFSTATKLRDNKVVVCSDADGTKGVALPSVGSDGGAYLTDQYVISNTGTTSLKLFASSGVTIAVNGSAHSVQPIQSFTTMIVWPVSTTAWIGLKGAA